MSGLIAETISTRAPRTRRRAAYSERVRGDGDGWVVSDITGKAYWGVHGAAGLLLRAPHPDGAHAVLLQHRAPWSHQGGTWGLPGGARDSHETPEDAAKREAEEEAGLPRDLLSVRATAVTAEESGTDWTYTTVLADADELLQTVPNMESAELRWVVEDEVTALPLHPGFAASWQRLRAALELVPWSPRDQARATPARTVEIEDGGLVLRIVGLAD
jgi:8-oxo-dGTP diphosphatase